MTSRESGKKRRGGGESIIGVIIQALVCKRRSGIDCVVFIALAVIDLLKPYLLLICDFNVWLVDQWRLNPVVTITEIFIYGAPLAQCFFKQDEVKGQLTTEGAAKHLPLAKTYE